MAQSMPQDLEITQVDRKLSGARSRAPFDASHHQQDNELGSLGHEFDDENASEFYNVSAR